MRNTLYQQLFGRDDNVAAHNPPRLPTYNNAVLQRLHTTPPVPDDFVLFHVKHDPTTTIIVADVQPKIRTIHMVAGGFKTHEFRVSLPYIVVCINLARWDHTVTFSSATLHYRVAPLRSLDDMLSRSNLPNMLYQEQICVGDTADLQHDLDRAHNDHDRAHAFLNDFWARPFSDHAFGHFTQSRTLHHAFRSLADWEAHSRRDPGFILRIPWQPLSTLRQHLAHFNAGFLL